MSMSSSSDATLEPGLDPKQAVRPGHVASLAGQSCSDQLEREPLVSRFRVFPRRVPPFISLCCAAVPAPYRIETPGPILDFSADSASRHLAQLCLLTHIYTTNFTHAHTDATRRSILFSGLRTSISWTARIARTWPLSGSTRTRQSCVSALSHSSFTYDYIISHLQLTDFTTARLTSLAVSQSL
ncbi:hypothetical protein DFH08DRAFT_1082599 [Mycena albidolilacea]|uniref:Uncharacterized protein n=1 Tax=Mycena albidolilacea TaxID=1033008 RepID=A0AAD6ZTS3_9AGAR|nr:hypothetical protein DFH08DRAFT_1082599 [Mycena albidolilacea]